MACWIPFFQTLVWPVFVIALIVYFRSTCRKILDAIADRIKSGSPLEAGPGGFKLGAISKEMEKLPDAPHKRLGVAKAVAQTQHDDWRQKRTEKYESVHGYMLVHVYRPSKIEGQSYDVFLFVVRHQKGTPGPPRRQLAQIEKAEFFFGESWDNQIFTVENSGGVIGVRTHAWGTFLACCRVTFKPDTKREPVVLFRYVDFHMLQDNPDVER